ncbi:MAG: response regulator [Bacteroidota bacterium]|uniref:Response regulator transcription factor n=1 Tax=Pedobacter cryotolerans TaxID=2571270 RepID=A0A4U1C9S4_9SPHI|nr:response regulator [Pedobacter cryotolerans]TKC03189.1 response regulator transcription factor [Pedobacter cryotolerans]
MFKKVLIAEDHESVSISVQKTLTELGIVYDNSNYVYYCDDAINRIKKAINDKNPYELLITDLSFEDDTPQLIKSGVELIKAIKLIQPTIKILVFSIENRLEIAKALIKDLDIDAFVPKARHDAKDMKLAIESILKNNKYLSPNLKQTSSVENPHQFSNYDKTIISLLANGMPQKDIPFYLEKNNIKPSGLSSIEKRLSHIKEVQGFTKNEQLIVFCKDGGII